MDNQASLSTFTDTAYKPHSKHVGVSICQIPEIIEDGKEVVMNYCSTERMVADGLTKPLPGVKHVVFVKMCSLSGCRWDVMCVYGQCLKFFKHSLMFSAFMG